MAERVVPEAARYRIRSETFGFDDAPDQLGLEFTSAERRPRRAAARAKDEGAEGGGHDRH